MCIRDSVLGCVLPVDRGAVVWVLVRDVGVGVVVVVRGACIVGGVVGARVVGTVGTVGTVGAGRGADGRGADGRGVAAVEAGVDPPFGCASAGLGRAAVSPTKRRMGTRIGAAGSKRHATRTMCDFRRISPTRMDPNRSNLGWLGSPGIPVFA